MKQAAPIVFGLLSFLLLRSDVWAWSGAGHMVIAAQAWRELPAGTQIKVTELLQAHPDYAKWQSSFSSDSANLDLSAFVFMRASTWPDEIRRHGDKYDHQHWHYIDYPLKPTRFPMEPAPSPDDDAVHGIEQSEKVLGDKKAPLEERAVSLSWLIHLVGDLHQPLHCASLFNETYPTGDKGGNDFYVKPGAKGIRLHGLWDGLLGTSGKPQSHMNYAIEIQTAQPRKSLKELGKHMTTKKWSLEGRGLAVEKVYLRGDLKGSTSAENAPELPEGYTRTAKQIAEKQAALAGYRLADEIRKVVR